MPAEKIFLVLKQGTTFSAIYKIEIYWNRLTFYFVEPRPKPKSYAKGVVKCLNNPSPRAKPGNPACRP